MSVAYTLGVSPAGYVAEHSYVFLAGIASAGYLLVALSMRSRSARRPQASEAASS